MDKIGVVVSGTGFMGREVLAAVAREADMEPLGVVEKFSQADSASLPDGRAIPLSSDPALIGQLKPRVVIDFTNAEWTPLVAEAALSCGASLVVGTTGQSEAFLQQLAAACKAKGIGAFVAPNFAIGAVIMIHLAKIASRYFDYAEISEMHQEKKVDAPSGTALLAAREMVAARGRPFERTMPQKEPLAGGRGAEYEGVSLHSQRMPGFVAHHEIVFGGLGQTLRIRHDSNGRESFIPGVLLATREIVNRRELIVGLDKLIGL
jgi:4-hydroxy-tetrahydrodipicolinate reductase